MFNITRKFVAVFQPRIDLNVSENMVLANLSTSKKKPGTDGNPAYENMTWKAKFVGEAFEPAKALRNGDKIDVISGIIENEYDKEKDKLYVNVTIFEFAMSDISKNNDDAAQDSPEDGQFSQINGDEK